MNLFIYEYTCASEPNSALRAEGVAMLAAIIEDFARIPETHVVTLLHPSMADVSYARCVYTTDEQTDFRRLAGNSDTTLVIAPETGGLLTQRCQWVEQSGGKLLGSPSAVVERLADKWECHQFLREHQMPTPRTVIVAANGLPLPFLFPGVCKPRWGAGAQSTFIVKNRAELAACLERNAGVEFVLQQFATGTPASVLCLAGPNQCLPLSPGEQHLNGDGQLQYLGGSAPLDDRLQERATRLAERLLKATPDCCGFIGIDMILGDAADGARDYVIEVNPRLTTSYLALRRLSEINLAERLLRLAQGETVPMPNWRPERVQYRVGCGEKGVALWPIR